MKKISYLLTAACAVLALSSCQQDRDPVYHAPTEGSFELYTPAMADQYIALNSEDVLTLTTSGQPDYGYSAVADYGVQISLTESFDEFQELTPVNAHLSNITVKQSAVALAIAELYGFEDEDDFNAKFPAGVYLPVYFRATCQLAGVEGSLIVSNVKSYNKIHPYYAVQTAGAIYLVGSFSGWSVDDPNAATIYANWRLFETAIGNKIYSGVFTVPAGDQYFRFYTELGNWGNDGELPSVGPLPNDNTNEAVVFEDGSYTSDAVPGKGSWHLNITEDMDITMVVDLSGAQDTWTVTFYQGEVEVFTPESLYLVGGYNNWAVPCVANEDQFYALKNSADAPAVFTGQYDVTPGQFWFRFATALAEEDGVWGPTIGWQEPDEGQVFEFTNNSFNGTYVDGSGSWCFDMPADGIFYMTVDTDAKTVKYTFEATE